jgi:hypothetical protein
MFGLLGSSSPAETPKPTKIVRPAEDSTSIPQAAARHRISRQGTIDHGPGRRTPGASEMLVHRVAPPCACVRSPTQAAAEAPTLRPQDWLPARTGTAHEFRICVAPGSRAGDLTARACGGARGFPAHGSDGRARTVGGCSQRLGAAGRWWSPNLPGTRRHRPGTHTCAIRSRARSDGRLTGATFARDLGALAYPSPSYHLAARRPSLLGPVLFIAACLPACLHLFSAGLGYESKRHGGDCLLCSLPAPARGRPSPCRRRPGVGVRACMGASWTVPSPPLRAPLHALAPASPRVFCGGDA